MFKDWKKWCRLCGYNNNTEIDVTIQFVNTDETVSTAALKYFGIMISPKSPGCGKICLICHDAVKSIIKYNEHVLKVNEMFLDLERNYFDESYDLRALREKYGLLNEEDSLYDHEGITNICSSQIKTGLNFKTESVSNYSSPKYNPKSDEYFNDINDANDDFLEPSLIEELNDGMKSWNEIKTKTEKLLEDNLEIKITKSIDSKKSVNREIINSNVKDKSSKTKILECEICRKTFQTTKGKTIHLKKQHSIKRGPPFKCNTCGRIFKRFQQLNIHESIHLSENERKYYRCPKCDKKFVSEWYVQDHIRIVHEGDRRFICELCGAAFGTNKNLLDHHLTHSEEKKFHCPKCNKAFKCKRTLKFHVETHDGTEYPCHICGLKLNTKRILRRHMLVHSDENKYKCNFCSKEFKRQYEFKNHLLLHTGLKLYQCPFCELTFSNGSNCRKHQRAVHPVELANAESKGTLMIVENVPSFKQLMAANEEALIRNKV